MVKLYVKELKGLKDKSIGLINHPHPENVFFKTRFGIHTFGMKFAIDVLILDKKNRVVSLKNSLKPYRIFIWNPKYNIVLELEEKTIQKNKIRIHDTIDLHVTH